MAALASVLALSGLLVISTPAVRKPRPEVGSCRELRADAKLSGRTVGDHRDFQDATFGDPLEGFGDGQKSDRETANARAAIPAVSWERYLRGDTGPIGNVRAQNPPAP
jgi:hypothetical protein